MKSSKPKLPLALPRRATVGKCPSVRNRLAALFATLLLPFSPESSFGAETLHGRATVIDGDTIAIEGVVARIRLYGIDAPEGKQTCTDADGQRYLCGSRSAQHLANLIGRSGHVRCTEEDRDRYGRTVAECVLPDGTNINRRMVQDGWAIEYARYSDGRYSHAERDAKASGRGIWAGDFEEPSRFRQGASDTTRRNPDTQSVRSGNRDGETEGCQIKGNVSRSGKIYHAPGQADYEKTRIDQSKGERWFCSSEDAEAAGWRAAKR